MNQVFKKIFSIVLLGVFLVAADPGHFIHQLADHKDTVESNTKGLSVSTKHIHCETLSFSLSAFLKLSGPLLGDPALIAIRIFPASGPFIAKVCTVIASGRAPPSLG